MKNDELNQKLLLDRQILPMNLDHALFQIRRRVLKEKDPSGHPIFSDDLNWVVLPCYNKTTCSLVVMTMK